MTSPETIRQTSMRVWLTGEDLPPTPSRRPVPTAGDNQLLVRVRTAAVNNGDLKGSGDELVAGFEFSGDVVGVGMGVDASLLGARVLGIAEGAFAEYVVAHHRHIVRAPGNLSDVEAAATPTAFTTEYGAAIAAKIQEGSTVLVTAASSSLGLIAIQVARELGSRRVIATTRSEDKASVLKDVGADTVLVTDNGGIDQATLDVTEGQGVDVVLDHIGGDSLDTVIAATREGGTVVSVGRLGGGTATLDLFALARRHVFLRSVSYGLTPPDVLGELFDGFTEVLEPAVRSGRIRPVVGAVFGFDEVGDALRTLGEGRTAGKIVITIP